MKNDQQEQNRFQYMPFGMCIGMSIGTAIGAGFENIATGMCMGLSIGMCVGVLLDHKLGTKNEDKAKLDEKEEGDTKISNDGTKENDNHGSIDF